MSRPPLQSGQELTRQTARCREAEVLAAAQAECQARGRLWLEPVQVTGALVRWRLCANASMRDGSPWLAFSRGGRLVRAGRAARRHREGCA